MDNIDELNEEMLKQNPPIPFQWKKGMLSPLEWEELYLQRPITIPDHTNGKTNEKSTNQKILNHEPPSPLSKKTYPSHNNPAKFSLQYNEKIKK